MKVTQSLIKELNNYLEDKGYRFYCEYLSYTDLISIKLPIELKGVILKPCLTIEAIKDIKDFFIYAKCLKVDFREDNSIIVVIGECK